MYDLKIIDIVGDNKILVITMLLAFSLDMYWHSASHAAAFTALVATSIAF